ncbi:MAG: NUDIX domain-containing protein [Bacteroidota bacterium]|nr:NUDIX domain-containing protein [Bacteroidota bacterium]
MYKVFYNQRIVFFVDYANHLEENAKIIKHFFKNKSLLQQVIDEFVNNENIQILYIIYSDIDFVFNQFRSFFTIIEAAGGLVKTPDERFLVIFRRGKWDLPKGKLEKPEPPEKGALREVEEECGITGLYIKKQLVITWHTYNLGNQPILKKTYWYEMAHSGNGKLKPQIEEEITLVQWMTKNDLPQIISNTFPSIIEVLQSGGVITS